MKGVAEATDKKKSDLDLVKQISIHSCTHSYLEFHSRPQSSWSFFSFFFGGGGGGGASRVKNVLSSFYLVSGPFNKRVHVEMLH